MCVGLKQLLDQSQCPSFCHFNLCSLLFRFVPLSDTSRSSKSQHAVIVWKSTHLLKLHSLSTLALLTYALMHSSWWPLAVAMITGFCYRLAVWDKCVCSTATLVGQSDNEKGIWTKWPHHTLSFNLQKYKEYLNGSNLIVKLQAKHDLLKQTLGEGETFFYTLHMVAMTENPSPWDSVKIRW